MMPLFIRLIIPSLMSSSVIGGGSACGSSLNFLGRILFGFDVFADFVIAKSIDFEP
jgi:hypothetical protein